MSEDLDRRLKAAVETRNSLASVLQKLLGRLESARENLTSVEDECRKNGIEPQDLENKIQLLQTEYAKSVSDLESQVEALRANLSPYEDIR